MADINEHTREYNNTGEASGNDVGVVAGDTIASALDPFGTAAGAVAGGAMDNKTGKGTVDDDNHGARTRD